MDMFNLRIFKIKFYLANNRKNGSKIKVQVFVLKIKNGKHGPSDTISS